MGQRRVKARRFFGFVLTKEKMNQIDA